MRELRQSTSVDLPIGPFLDGTDGVTPETSLTLTRPDIRLKKNGGAWAQKAAAQTLSHEENGFYEVTLDATDTDTLGCLRLAVFESGAAPVWEDFMVLTQGEWDAKYATAVRPTAAENAAAVWDLTTTGHDNGGTFGELLPNIASNASSAASSASSANSNILMVSAAVDDIPDNTWTAAVDGDTTAAESMRLQNSALAGKLSGAGTGTETVRDLADSKDRLVYEVDEDGNRTTVTRDLS